MMKCTGTARTLTIHPEVCYFCCDMSGQLFEDIFLTRHVIM